MFDICDIVIDRIRNWSRITDSGIGIASELKDTGLRNWECWQLEQELARNRVGCIRTQPFSDVSLFGKGGRNKIFSHAVDSLSLLQLCCNRTNTLTSHIHSLNLNLTFLSENSYNYCRGTFTRYKFRAYLMIKRSPYFRFLTDYSSL